MPHSLPEPTYVESFDATRLAVYELGLKDRNAPVLFLVNGLGGNLVAWRFVIAAFKDKFRVVSYDYRGMYGSQAPPGRDFSMEAHTRDALAVMDHAQVDKAVFMGWSMGVQILLEVFDRVPDRAVALVLANGAYGKPLDVAMPRLKPLAGVAMDLLVVAAPAVRLLSKPLLATPIILKMAKAIGLVSEQLDEGVFLDLARDYVQLDFVAFRDCVETLITHDAEHVLRKIDVPTLILGGGRDFFTPRSFSEEMAGRIDGAELHIINDASHYCAVEYPDVIVVRMKKFFREHLDL